MVEDMTQFLIPMCHQKKISARHASPSIKVRPSHHHSDWKSTSQSTTRIPKPFIKYPPEIPNVLFPSVHTINTSLLTMTSTCQGAGSVITLSYISVSNAYVFGTTSLCFMRTSVNLTSQTDRNKAADRQTVCLSAPRPGLRGHSVALLSVRRNAGTK